MRGNRQVPGVETGKGAVALASRPKLAAALRAARRIDKGCPAIVAKLDRMSHDVHFISRLMQHRLPFIVVELGSDTDPFMLHAYAAVAKERRLISERTKAGFAAAKRRGVNLGGRNAQSDKTAAEAAERAEQLRPVLAELAGLSARKAATELNRRKVPTPAGGQWFATQVIRLRQRLEHGEKRLQQRSLKAQRKAAVRASISFPPDLYEEKWPPVVIKGHVS